MKLDLYENYTLYDDHFSGNFNILKYDLMQYQHKGNELIIHFVESYILPFDGVTQKREFNIPVEEDYYAYTCLPYLEKLKFKSGLKLNINKYDNFKEKYKVQFNSKKKATTLIDNHLNEVTVVRCTKDDEYDKKYGFLLAYFQHNSGMSKTQCNKYLKEITDEE